MEYVLTPRYKGLQVLREHDKGENTASMTMAYVDKTKPQEQEGWLMNCKLTSSKRVVPDLYSLYKNPMDIYVKYDPFDHGDDWRAKQTTPEEVGDVVRAALFKDYYRKDLLMGLFEKH